MKIKAIITSIFLLYGASMHSISVMQHVRYYIAGFRKSCWKQGHVPSAEEVELQKKLFGYDLSITHIKDRALSTVHLSKKRVKLFVHGFSENKNQAMVFAGQYGVIAGDFVTFNLPDRVSMFSPIINRIYKTSFGQLNEILPTLYVLSYLKSQLGLEAIDLVGYSRGAAVIANMLYVLTDTSGTYDDALSAIGIDTKERAALIALIENGSILLSCPLISMKRVFEDHWFISNVPGHMTAIEYTTSYKKDGLDPFESLKKIKKLKSRILLHLQHNDESVGNAYDADVYTTLARLNSVGTYLLLGNDGGHKVEPKSLRKAVHTFYRNVGASYNLVEDALYQKRLKGNFSRLNFLQQPTIKAAPGLIKQLHADYE